MYIVYSDAKGNLQKILLAVRRFRPSPIIQGKGSQIVKEWLISVLEEFQIDYKKHALISNTDAGSDVKKLATKLLPREKDSLLENHLGRNVVSLAYTSFSPACMAFLTHSCMSQDWEWCICHMANCALLEAFGINIDRKKATFKEGREIFDRVTKTIETLNKSQNAKVSKTMFFVLII